MDIPEEKQLLRTEMRTILQKMPVAIRGQESQTIVRNILNLPVYSDCDIIFGFIPIRTEPDLSSLYDYALAQGKKVAFPRCLPNGEMAFHGVTEDWRHHVTKSPFRNLEPDGAFYESVWEPTLGPAIILVPGLAFSPLGQRLGRSKGYFDRFLGNKAPQMFSVGVCFELQIRKNIPTEPHDSTLDSVVTESNIYWMGELQSQEKC